MSLLPQKISFREKQAGQALLLVLLSMAVVLTIILSILSRTITDISITTREEEALRAFSAAEAGVERALIVGTNTGDFGSDSSFTATVTNFGYQESEYVYPEKLLSGESAIIWFVDHDEDTGELTCSTNECFVGNIMNVCWGALGTDSGSSTTPAIEVSVFYAETPGDYSTVKIARETLDPNAGRRAANNFGAPDAGTCTVGGTDFEFQKVVNFATLGVPAGSYSNQNGLQFAKIRVLYNTDVAHELGVNVTASGDDLPSQGVMIESVGISGESNRRIEVSQTFGELPPIFDSVLFSPGGIVK